MDEPAPDTCQCQAPITFGHEPHCPERPESHMTQAVPRSPWYARSPWVVSVPPPPEQDDGL